MEIQELYDMFRDLKKDIKEMEGKLNDFFQYQINLTELRAQVEQNIKTLSRFESKLLSLELEMKENVQQSKIGYRKNLDEIYELKNASDKNIARGTRKIIWQVATIIIASIIAVIINILKIGV